MGQDLSQLTENVPSLLGGVLLKMGQEVAMDLHESSMQDLFEVDDDVIAKEEEMAMASSRYFGIWQDEKGRPFYYDVEHRAYFFLENSQPSNIACEKEHTSPPSSPTKTNNSFHHHHNNDTREEEEEECSTSSDIPPPKRPPISSVTLAPPVSHLSFLTHKIMMDLGIIYSNVTHSVSMLLLERGDGLERTRQKLDEMMDAASSLERQSRCLTCAQRCNTIWPGTGYTFILKIADIIPMSACCQDDGVCGPYVFMSDEEEVDEDTDLDELQHGESIPDNLTDCHLE